MTTIQKFEEALTTPNGELDALNPSENVLVMVDEAHRTQYGILGGRMSKALPRAALIGFTGTPIEKSFKHSTIGRFGPLIDSYTIPQSVADGATVPIYYEARLPELAIEGPETLDRLYDAMFGEELPAVQTQIRRRYANKETVAGAERRIEMIALDIADHFKAKLRPQRVQGTGCRANPSGGPPLRRALEQLWRARLPDYHRRPQRRPGVQGGPRARPRAGHPRLRRPGGGTGGPRRGGHAAHGVRCAGGAGPLLGPGDERARPASSHRQGQPPVLP